MIRPLIMGSSGRVGTLLRLAWSRDPELGVAPVWQSRAPGEVASVAWSLAEGAEALAARVADKGINMILCLAGVPPHPPRSGGDDYALNVALAAAALQAGQRLGVKHVFLTSSAAVYGAADGPLAETTSLRPSSDYGQSKKEMEAMARAWAATHRADAPRLTCLRIGNLVGADQLCLPAAGAKATPVRLDRFSDGQGPCRSYIGPLGLSRVLGRLFGLAGQGHALPLALNVATPGPVRMSDLLAALGVAWIWQRAPAEAVQTVQLDVTRLCRLHGFTAADSRAEHMVAEWQFLGGGAA